MMKKHQPEYEEINLIDYIHTIKKHIALIGGIALGMAVIAVLVSMQIGPISAVEYSSEAVVSLGTIQEEQIEPAEKVIDFLMLQDRITVEKGKSPATIVITSKDSSPAKARGYLEEAVGSLLSRHKTMVEKKTKFLNDRIASIEKSLKENEERLNRFEGMLNRLSPFDQAQVIALGAYLDAYNQALLKKEGLERELQEIEFKKSEYGETKLLNTPRITSLSASKRTFPAVVASLVGLFLGIVLGIFWAFGKEWWETNKKFLS